MPVEVGIWKLGKKVERVELTSLPSEGRLEEILAEDISILDPNLLLIGRQVPTTFGNFVDLLAIDADGNLVVIELKRSRTPREVVAQLLDYGSWVRKLDDENIAAIFDEHLRKYCPGRDKTSLDQAFCEHFGVREMPEALNEGHELVVVASALDPSTERIVNYLADEYGVAVNAVFFRFFQDGGKKYLSRVWLIDPGEVEAKVVALRGREPWNGEFYVSFGDGQYRGWADARKYGFVSGGRGPWYSKTLSVLKPGDRVWVNVPGRGYVGIGRVTQEVVPANEFKVADKSGKSVLISMLPLRVPKILNTDGPKEEWEYLVGVKWVKTVSLEEAIKEKGFFGNQNTVAKPRAKKWVHTVERLKKRLGIED